MNLDQAKCIIIKIGSALLVDANNMAIHHKWLMGLAEDVIQLREQGKQVILVSSGAIAFGKLITKLGKQKNALAVKQALAAVGQVQLMHTYQQLFSVHNVDVAQVLLTLDDTENRQRFINLRNTLKTLLDLNIIPIINENDSIATAEIRYGDNDRLAARVIQMVDADALILLSDIDGLYTDDPTVNPDAQLIPEVTSITDRVMSYAKDSSSNFGSGGMISKLAAAKIAIKCGCNMLITYGKHQNPIQWYLKQKKGTWFFAETSANSAKKQWLQQYLKVTATIMVDDGAAQALQAGASLLAVGVKKIDKHFSQGDAVTITNLRGETIARGLINFCSDDMHKIMGQQSTQFQALLGYETSDTVVHRDNMVML